MWNINIYLFTFFICRDHIWFVKLFLCKDRQTHTHTCVYIYTHTRRSYTRYVQIFVEHPVSVQRISCDFITHTKKSNTPGWGVTGVIAELSLTEPTSGRPSGRLPLPTRSVRDVKSPVMKFSSSFHPRRTRTSCLIITKCSLRRDSLRGLTASGWLRCLRRKRANLASLASVPLYLAADASGGTAG